MHVGALPLAFLEVGDVWERLTRLGGDRRAQVAAAVMASLFIGHLLLRLPRPPEPGIVATYQGGRVTKEELRPYLHEYLPRCPKHLRCPRHGEDHDSCAAGESCETFTDCDDEHDRLHTLPVYRNAAASLVADRLIGGLVAEKRLGETKEVRHLMKHVTEEINVSDLRGDWYKRKIRVEESEVEAYYEANRSTFGSSSLSEVAESIRAVLTQTKEEEFLEDYLRKLRENSGLSINYDLLEYPEPDDEQLRTAFFEGREEFRLPARVKLLLVGVPMDASEAAREARTLLLGGAAPAEVRKSLAGTAQGVTVAEQAGVSSEDALWGKLRLGRTVRGEVTDVVTEGGQLLVARVEKREEAREARFEEVRERLMRAEARRLRERHLKENRNATLFTVHGEPYSLGDFMEEFDELSPLQQARYDTFEGRKELVDRMVERALVVEETSDEMRGSKTRKQIDRVRLEVLRQVLHQEEVDDKITVTDEELRSFFEEHKRSYRRPARVKISHIRIACGSSDEEEQRAQQKAEKALAEFEALSAEQLAGDGFARVAERYSDDPDVVVTGGQVEDWISESGDLVTEMFYHEFHKNVLPLNKGEISPVFRMGDSFYIAFVREREEARDPSFEEVQQYVRTDLTAVEHYERTARMEVDLARKADAKIYDYTLLQMLSEEKQPSGKRR